MKRYGFELKETRSKVPGWPSTYEWELIEQEAGDYYLVADSQARIDELEAALRNINKRVRRIAGTQPERGTWRFDVLAICDQALALAQKEKADENR